MTRAQRSYHAFVRAAKRESGISHRQAIAVYRDFKARFGSVRVADIKSHPRIFGREVDKARKEVPERFEGTRVRGARTIATFRDWFDFYDDLPDEDLEYEASADYGDE